jgi:predicted nucleotidyltransferase
MMHGNVGGGSGFCIAMAIVRTQQDLIGRLRHHRDDLRRLGRLRLGLLDSFQRGESDLDSDVDLLVEVVD